MHPPCPLCTQDQLNFAQQALTKTQKTQAQMVICIPASFPCKPYHEYVEISELNTSYWSTKSCTHCLFVILMLFCGCEILKVLLTPAQPSFLTPSQVTRRSNPVSRLKLKRTSLFYRVGLVGCAFVSFWDENVWTGLLKLGQVIKSHFRYKFPFRYISSALNPYHCRSGISPPECRTCKRQRPASQKMRRLWVSWLEDESGRPKDVVRRFMSTDRNGLGFGRSVGCVSS